MGVEDTSVSWLGQLYNIFNGSLGSYKIYKICKNCLKCFINNERPTGQKQQLLYGTTVENKGKLILSSKVAASIAASEATTYNGTLSQAIRKPLWPR